MDIWSTTVSTLGEIIPLLVGGSLLLFTLWVASVVVNFLQQLKHPSVVFEIKPPYEYTKMPFATQQWYGVLHGLAYGLKDLSNFIKEGQVRFSFEMVSTKEEGIVFYLACPQGLKETVFNALQAKASACEIKEVEYAPRFANQSVVVEELKQKNHFAFPLKEHKDFDKDDPITYISGAMARAEKGEVVGFQLVARPFVGIWASIKRNQADRVKDVIYTQKRKTPEGIVSQLFRLPLVVMELFIPSDHPLGTKPVEEKRIDHTPEEEEYYKNVHDKAGLPWFDCSLRLYSGARSPQKAKDRVRSLVSAFGALEVPGRQGLARKLFSVKPVSLFFLENRIVSPLGGGLLLSAKEMTDIYHLPFTPTVEIEGIKMSRAKELPAPLYFTSEKTRLENVFAVNRYGGRETKIGVEKESRRLHVSIIGGTGMGKTTLLLNMIINDIKNGEGVGVIDPHGDLTEKILGRIPKNRINDVVLFDPADHIKPLGFNFFELEQKSDEEKNKEKSRVCDEFVAIFMKLYYDFMGPRSEHILRNTVLAVLDLPDPVLGFALRMLRDKDFQKTVAYRVQNQEVKDFWLTEFPGMGPRLSSDAIAPILNKLGRFLTDPMLKNILNQKRSTFNLGEVMDNGKIFLANLAQGKTGEENSRFLGSLLIAKFQLSIMRRADRREELREDFYLYVDEFQNFANLSFRPILSEARKYRLNLIMANQTFGQIPEELQEVITSNVGLMIAFKTNNPKDADVLVPIFAPKVTTFDLFNLNKYKVYMKLLAGESSDSFSADTLPESEGFDLKKIEVVKEHSREKYGRDIKSVEMEMKEKVPWVYEALKKRKRRKLPTKKGKKLPIIDRPDDSIHAKT